MFENTQKPINHFMQNYSYFSMNIHLMKKEKPKAFNALFPVNFLINLIKWHHPFSIIVPFFHQIQMEEKSLFLFYDIFDTNLWISGQQGKISKNSSIEKNVFLIFLHISFEYTKNILYIFWYFYLFLYIQ